MGRPKKIEAQPLTGTSDVQVDIIETTAENLAPFERDEKGLLKEVEYVYQGKYIDWRAMIDSKWLYVNKQWFTKRSKEIPESIEGLKDEQLCIRLAGLKELLRLRGKTAVRCKPTVAGPEYAAAVCSIDYIPNFETENKAETYEEWADAHWGNTEGINRSFLACTAMNRAFARAIRNFLNIHIVSVEEMGGKTEEAAQTSEDPGNSRQRLKERAEKLGLTLENLVEKINLAREPDKQVSWTDWDQIKPAAAMKLLTILKKKKD